MSQRDKVFSEVSRDGHASNISGASSRAFSTESRAKASKGTSAGAIYHLVTQTIQDSHPSGGLLLDIGCGTGELFKYIRGLGYDYIGSDLIRFETYPEGEDFRTVDLDTGRVDMLDGVANVVACVETIEHVQNPRAIMGELARLARPGGLIVVTTPNQISIMSKLCLLLRNQFPAFQERPGLYPAHITALLPIDLLRMANELGLDEPILRYSNSGRIPGTRWHWPWPLRGHNFSDNVLLAARRPM